MGAPVDALGLEIEQLRAALASQAEQLEAAHKREEHLHATELQLRLFAEHSHHVFFRMRLPDGQYEYMSPAATNLSGYTPQECYETPFFALKVMPTEWQEIFRITWPKVLAGHVAPFIEYPLLRKSGEPRWVHQQNWLVWDEAHEKPIALEGIVIDITEQHRAEQALRDSELQYRTTIDAMGDLLHVVDDSLRIVLINQAGRIWAKELGNPVEPVGKTVFEVFPFLPESVRAEYLSVFHSGLPLLTEESNHIAGRKYVTETRKMPISEGGKISRVITIVRDTTDRVRAQERLGQAEKMQALGQLAGGVAHDFNNQLTAILGCAEMLVRRLPDAELREHATMIARAATRSAHLTRQLLAFARKGLHHAERVDVHNLIDEVVGLLEHTIDKRIHIRQQLAAEPSTTMGDPVQLQNALLNLAINARDAMPSGGVLTFSTQVMELRDEYCQKAAQKISPGRFIEIAVADSGEGMTPETQKRLFEPFFTTKALGKGTGMGLAAVYGTVINHHGAIRVKSDLGHGSVFCVQLPLVPCADAPDPTAATESTTRGGSHILLADDEAGARETAAAALRDYGYRVTALHDGIQALEHYRTNWRDIDLVILDMLMPDLNGLDTLVAMRQLNPKLKALLISGHNVDNQAQYLQQSGVSGFILKPFHLSDLYSQVAAALRK